jgi:hypothetical protein
MATHGYRERVFLKSWLVALAGLAEDFPDILEESRYDPSGDCWHLPSGICVEVEHEGSESREILAKRGLDDSDCKEG